MKKILQAQILLVFILYITASASAQNIKLTSVNGKIQRGGFHSINENIIVIKSFKDKKLYGYQLDSISKLTLQKGHGFLKPSATTFLAISVLFVGIDMYAVTLGDGIEMIPASAFIPIIAFPAAIVVGTVGYLSTKYKRYDLATNNRSEIQDGLSKYCQAFPDTSQYMRSHFLGTDKKSLFNFQASKNRFVFYFGATGKTNSIKKSALNLIAPAEYSYVKMNRESYLRSYHIGFAYKLNSNVRLGVEQFGNQGKEISLRTPNSSDSRGYLDFKFAEDSERARRFFVDYTVLGDNLKPHKKMVSVGISAVKMNRDFYYELTSIDFMKITYSLPYGNSINYTYPKNWGLGVNTTAEIPVKGNATLGLSAFANFFRPLSFRDYTMTFIETGAKIHIDQTTVPIIDLGIKVSLNFHL